MHSDKVRCFLINLFKNSTKFRDIKEEQLYDRSLNGIKRKAFIEDNQQCFQERFVDQNFQLQKSNEYTTIRMFDLYQQKQIDIFPQNDDSCSLIDFQRQYNSFLAQSGLLQVRYLKTLFITNKVNKEGFYQYFIKKDGEYYVNCIDDTIPVDKKTKQPLWGLNKKYPWQILLLKAWLKEKRSFRKFQQTQPFQILDAFGFPAYKNFNFAKQIHFIKNEKSTMSDRQQSMRNAALNKKNVHIYAKTVNSSKLQKVGLPENLVAFKINLISSDNEQPFYRIESSVPVSWTGKNTLVSKNNLKNSVVKHKLNLETSFVMTQREVLKYFSKFYVVPHATLELQKVKVQDTFIVDNQKEENWISFKVPEDQGLLTISFELPKRSCDHRGKYSDISFFLSKKNTEDEIARSHIREDIDSSQQIGNIYIDSDCDKWEHYQIDFHQGYYHNNVSFTKISPGQYVLYAKVSPFVPYKIRFNSQVNFIRPQFAYLGGEEIKVIFDSTFYGISRQFGIETSLKNQTFQESISFANTFDELGFGCIAIKTMANAKHKVAMRIFPEKLKQNGLDICDHYYEVKEGQGKDKNFILQSVKGRPQIIVLRRINNDRNELNKPFPPPQTVQFYKVTPNSAYKTQVKKSVKKK